MRARSGRLEPFETAVRDHVASHGLFDGCERVVAAVSGGPDSMAMLYALVRIRAVKADWPAIVVAHLDHALRGPDSTADAAFVRGKAEEVGLECVVRRVDVAAEARQRSANLEAVARDIRYAFLAEVAATRNASRVATAHTASDQAETVVMRLARGAGVDGLSGIAVRRSLGDVAGVELVRPLLGVARADVVAYCRDRDIAFRTDVTNEDLDRTRAAIRLRVIPELERLSPGAAANMARAAELAADDRELLSSLALAAYGACVDETCDRIALVVDELVRVARPLRRRVLREAYRSARGDLKRLTLEHVDSLDGLLAPDRTGREVSLPGGLTARRTRRHVILTQTVEK